MWRSPLDMQAMGNSTADESSRKMNAGPPPSDPRSVITLKNLGPPIHSMPLARKHVKRNVSQYTSHSRKLGMNHNRTVALTPVVLKAPGKRLHYTNDPEAFQKQAVFFPGPPLHDPKNSSGLIQTLLPQVPPQKLLQNNQTLDLVRHFQPPARLMTNVSRRLMSKEAFHSVGQQVFREVAVQNLPRLDTISRNTSIGFNRNAIPFQSPFDMLNRLPLPANNRSVYGRLPDIRISQPVHWPAFGAETRLGMRQAVPNYGNIQVRSMNSHRIQVWYCTLKWAGWYLPATLMFVYPWLYFGKTFTMNVCTTKSNFLFLFLPCSAFVAVRTSPWEIGYLVKGLAGCS